MGRRSWLVAGIAAWLIVGVSGAVANAQTGNTTGSSCANPQTWQLHARELPPEGDIARGPVDIQTSDGYAFDFTATASGPWRICDIHGTYRNGKAWWLPGTVGDAHHKSLAERAIELGPTAVGTFVVSYARRTSSDGTTCAAPRAVYSGYDGDHGDAGAQVSIESQFSGSPDREPSRIFAHWQLEPTSQLCYVKGWDFYGQPFTIRRHES